MIRRTLEYHCDECGVDKEVDINKTQQQTPFFFSGKETVCYDCMRKNHNLVCKKKQDVKR